MSGIILSWFESPVKIERDIPCIFCKHGTSYCLALDRAVFELEAQLETALGDLVGKGCYYPDWMTRKVMQTISGKDVFEEDTKVRLQDREIEFLQYAASELTYREIAEKMFCSPRTVESYRDSLFGKLGYKTRIGLLMYALRKGIIKL